MRMVDLLVQAKLVTNEDVAEGLEPMVGSGGLVGDNLVAIGAITQKVLNDFLHRIPKTAILHLRIFFF